MQRLLLLLFIILTIAAPCLAGERKEFSSGVRPGDVLQPVAGGAVNTRTGQFYQESGPGLVNTRNGQYLPKTDGGYVDPKSGRLIPVPEDQK